MTPYDRAYDLEPFQPVDRGREHVTVCRCRSERIKPSRASSVHVHIWEGVP